MKEDHINHLKKAMQQLPTYKPKEETWQQIADFLDIEDSLQEVIPELPEQVPTDNLWQHIETQMDVRIHLCPQTWWTLWKPYLSAAACLACVWIVWKSYTKLPPEENISYAEEFGSMPVQEKVPDDRLLDNELMGYIEKTCLSQQPVCYSQEFIALKADLEELNKAERELTATMEQYGATPDMVKYQIRIENLKAETAKVLVQMTL